MAGEDAENRFLHMRLVDFITTGNRVFRCEWPSTWDDFLHEFPQYYDQNKDFIRKEFFDKVLPRILAFDLSLEQKKCVNLFDSYPGVVKTPRGYRLLITEEVLQQKLNTCAVQGEDYVKLEQYNPTLHSTISAIFTSTTEFFELKRRFCNDLTIQAWCSALVSSEDELMDEVFLPYEEIKTRLLRIKDELRMSGSLGTFLDYERVEDQLKRLREFKNELQRKIKEILNSRRRLSFGQ